VRDIKAALNQLDYQLEWRPRRAVHGAPQLTLYLSAGPVVVGLEAAHDPVTITGVEDLRTLLAPGFTLAGARGLAGMKGRAFFVTEDAGVLSVRIAQIQDGSLKLAEPLERASSGGVLQWALWTATLPAAATSAVDRNRKAWIKYQELIGADRPTPPRIDRALYHCVHSPFDTGLTSYELGEEFSELLNLRRRGREGFEYSIEKALDAVIKKIRAEFSGRSPAITEDDILSPGDFFQPHAYIAASNVLMKTDRDLAERYRSIGFASLGDVLKAVRAVDLNGDGEIDEGEQDGAVSPGVAAPAGIQVPDRDYCERRFTTGPRGYRGY
jgi:hypothetical protein